MKLQSNLKAKATPKPESKLKPKLKPKPKVNLQQATKKFEKRKKRSKLLAVLLASSLFTLMLGACAKDKTDGDTLPGPEFGGVSQAGRYVEKEAALPPELADLAVAHMYAVENTLHLLVMKDQDGKICLQEWILQDGVFTEATRDWLADLALPDTDWLETKLVQGTDGTQYLYAKYAQKDEVSGYSVTGHLWKGTADGAVEITPEKWSVPNEEWGSYEMIQDLAVLDNDTLATLSYTSIDILSAQDGSVLGSEPCSAIYEGNIATDGTNLYLCSSDGTGSQIEKRKDGKGEGALTIPFPADGSAGNVFSFGGGGSLFVDVLGDGALIAASEKGIFRLPGNAPEDEWEQLAAGIDTDFSTPDCWCMNMAALENGGIYALFSAGGEQKLNYYQYDPDAVLEVTQVLKLYTVYESSLLKQAAAMYHKLHPEVIIDVESEYPLYSYETPDYDAIYKKLNTRLMGSEAPDILVMDHLNMDSYAKMGLLENLDDIIRPLEESGELLSNITGAYRNEDGRRYVVPLQFDFTLAIGRDIAPENMRSLEALADFLSHADYSYLGEQTVTELVDMFYPYFCGKIVRDKQLDKEALGKYLGYLKAIADNCGIVASHPEDDALGGMWSLTATAKLALENAKGFSGCMTSMSMVDYIEGDFTAFENSFAPSIQTGICAKSQYLDTAKDFLQFALSRQVQDYEYNRGFPVNSQSLKEQSQNDRSNWSFFTMIPVSGGGYLEFEGKAYSKETAERLIALSETLDTPAGEDARIRETLLECLEEYLKGSRSLEDTIAKIESGLKMYLAE